MKQQIVHTLQKYVLNPPIKGLFAMGVAPPGYALFETTGRKTGKARRTPVGDARVGNQFWIVAEHGMKAGYVRNLVRHPRARETAHRARRSMAHRYRACAPGR
jgi:deazaflavin-dependent oxidoreductase (nitroreductase family)